MDSKTISSLAMLKTYIDKGLDYIDVFVPFLLNIIENKHYEEINAPFKIRRDFKKIYGLDMPYHATVSIINRAKRKGYLKRQAGKYLPVWERINEIDFDSSNARQERQINKLLVSANKYILDKFNKDISKAELENLLFDYIEHYGINILKRNKLKRDFKEEKYFLNRYIEYTINNSPDEFNYLVDITLGQALLSLIICENEQEQECNKNSLKEISCYLDADILFNLLGASGVKIQDAYADFINTLSDAGVKLLTFDHTYNEVLTILNNCCIYIGNPIFDLKKASKTMLYFYHRGAKKSDIKEFIARIKPTLSKFNINVIRKPCYPEDGRYQIDEEEFRDTITPIYNNVNLLDFEKEGTINRDVDSISAIYRLREGKNSLTINDTNHIFITTNYNLVNVSYKYEVNKLKSFGIPMCVTDIFMGTSLWANNPQKYIEINRKKFIADIHAFLQPDVQLMRSYLQKVQELYNKKEVNKDEYYLLRTSDIAQNLLQEKTCNDAGRFLNKTPEEILSEIKHELSEEELQKLKTEQESHKKTKLELDRIRSKGEMLSNKVYKAIDLISEWLSYGIFIFLSILFFISLFSFIDSIVTSTALKIVIKIIAIIFAVMGGFYGLSVRDVKTKVKNYIKKLLINWFEK